MRIRRSSRRWPGLLLTAVMLGVFGMLLVSGRGWAHAAPVGLEPPHGAQLDESPAVLRLRFTQPVELAFSRVRVSTGDRLLSTVGPLRLEGDRVAVVDLPPLDPDQYHVSWRVISVDGHVTEGNYSFTVMVGARPGSHTVSAAGGLGTEKNEMAGLYGAGIVVAVTLLSLLAGRIRLIRRRGSAHRLLDR